MKATALPPLHLLLALAVVAVWGTNFVIIKEALGDLPPLFFATLRFTFAAVPLVFFVRRPSVRWTNLAAYGVLLGVGQFGIMFIALRSDITPGLASLIIQVQVFFTIGMAMLLSGERLRPVQWLALLLAVAGIAVVMSRTGGDTTVRGVLLVIVAAFGWAAANIVGKRAGPQDALAYIAWASLFAGPPLLLLSLAVDGPSAIEAGLRDSSAWTWAAVAWQSVGNTIFGYGSWNWLLARHDAGTISPIALLVPVFGFAASAAWLDEPLPGWKLMASALVIAGLALNTAASTISARRRRPATAPA